jgi:hypothetical protein
MRAAALIGVVGIAGTAFAQGGSANWLSDVVIADDGSTATVTWSLNMNGDTPFVALSATIFDTINTSGAEYGSISSWSVLNNLADLTGDLTTSDGTNLFGTNAGQLTVFGPFTSANPIDVLEFVFTANDGVVLMEGDDINYETSTENVTLWLGDSKETASAVDVTQSVGEGVARFGVVPAPASLALLGFGGLALARRRR